MKRTFSDKIIAWMALLSGLTISAVAIWYSVAGLVSIFAAAVIPIIVMGVVLEVSKLIATVWLKINWNRAPIFIRTYLLVAIAILMVITSMGIFGFLSKAHSDQSLVSGDVQAKIAVYDERIKTERENIEAARKALKQMDATIDETIARSKTDQGAVNANTMRQRQAKERAQIQSDIAKSQKLIASLNEERAPIAAEVRKVEAEVGPIKYIAAFVYGDNPDANLLEKAVTWVIIIIVSVFDPLAVILLLASQYSFQWFRTVREEDHMGKHFQEVADSFNEVFADELKQEPKVKSEPFYPTGSPLWPFPAAQYLKETTHTDPVPSETPLTALGGDITAPEEMHEEDDELDDENDTVEVREAKKNWKHDHPDDSLKRHKRLFEKGLIDRLPWEAYLKARPDFTDNDAAEEAAKWAMEQIEESKKKDNDMDGTGGQPAGKEDQGRVEGYVQNAEQTPSTLWQRVQKAKGAE
jgi:hypothetical protein